MSQLPRLAQRRHTRRMARFLLAAFAGGPLLLVGYLFAAPRAAQNAPPPAAGSNDAGSVNVSRTSWIGNSFSGKNGEYMVSFCDAIYAAPNGTVYTNTFFEEGGHEIAVYGWDAVKSAWASKGAGTFSHGAGGRAITGNDDYLWTGQMLTAENGKTVQFGIVRRDLRYPELPPTPWKTGGSTAGATGWLPSFLALSPPLSPDPGDPTKDAITLWRQRSVRGIAATKTRLFVSVPGEAESQNAIRVFDISRPDTIAPVTSWRVPNAAQIAYDANRGEVWVLQNAHPENGDGVQGRYVIWCFDAAKGVVKPARTITLPPGTNPSSLAWDARNHRLLVSDWGAAQQIRVFSTTTAVPTAAAPPLGETGGLWGGTTTQGRFVDTDAAAAANPGSNKTVRLFGPRAVSVDAGGNVYVVGAGANGMVRLDSLTPTGGPLHPPVFAAEAVSIADADPAELTDVFSDSKHYRLNYGQNAPGREGKLVGLTANLVVFPQDPRFSVPGGPTGIRVAYLQNRRFLLVKFDRALAVYRFDPAHFGETAIPCVLIAEEMVSVKNWPFWTPNVSQWIWRDLNGDGKFDKNEFALPPNYQNGSVPSLSPIPMWAVDKNGTLLAIRETYRELMQYKLHGLDKWGSPIYDAGGTSDKVGTVTPQLEASLPPPFQNDQDRFAHLGQFGFPGGAVNRLTYDAASDTMFMCGYSITHPDTLQARIKAGHMAYSNPPVSGPPGQETGWKKDEENDGSAAGRLLVAYPHWSQGGRTPLWVQPLPFHSAAANDYFKADIPNGIAAAGRFVFVGYRYSQKILIYDAQTGKLRPEYLLPDANIVGDNHGALDTAQPISAIFLPPDKALGRPNGEYVVWAESNTRARILMHRWKPPAK